MLQWALENQMPNEMFRKSYKAFLSDTVLEISEANNILRILICKILGF